MAKGIDVKGDTGEVDPRPLRKRRLVRIRTVGPDPMDLELEIDGVPQHDVTRLVFEAGPDGEFPRLTLHRIVTQRYEIDGEAEVIEAIAKEGLEAATRHAEVLQRFAVYTPEVQGILDGILTDCARYRALRARVSQTGHVARVVLPFGDLTNDVTSPLELDTMADRLREQVRKDIEEAAVVAARQDAESTSTSPSSTTDSPKDDAPGQPD